MCGIVGAVAQRNIYPILIEGLKRLEYRGYDSAGVAVIDSKDCLTIRKTLGKVAALEKLSADAELRALNMFLSLANRSVDLFNAGTKIIEKTAEDQELKINKLQSTIESAKDKYQSNLNAIQGSHQDELNSIKNKHKVELAIQSERHAKQSSDLRIKNQQSKKRL